MKILLIAPISSVHVIRWANSLVGHVNELHLASMHDAIEPLDEKIILHKLPFKAPTGYILNFRKLKKIIKIVSPDLIHTHQLTGHGILSFISVNKDSNKHLVSMYGSDIFDFPNKSWLHSYAIKLVATNATKLASTSEAMKNQFLQLYPDNKLEIFVTPFGVDTERFSPIPDRRNTDTFKIGFAKTWLFDLYGLDHLIEAFAKFQKDHHNSELHIVGIGGVLEQLKEQVKEFGLESYVYFHGLIKNNSIPKFINTWDVAVYPSLKESFGVSIVEASACGIPVIASNVGGLPEVIDNNKTGYLIEPNQSEGIYSKLIDLYQNPQKREAFGEAGRQKVLTLYDWNNNVTHMLNIYKKIIGTD